MEFSTDEQHADTLNLLREALEYLERLPTVPLTRELCRRVQHHLDEPLARLLEEKRLNEGQLRGAGAFTPAGLPVVLARVKWPEELLLWSPKPPLRADYEVAAKQLVRTVFGSGYRLKLTKHLDEPPVREDSESSR